MLQFFLTFDFFKIINEKGIVIKICLLICPLRLRTAKSFEREKSEYCQVLFSNYKQRNKNNDRHHKQSHIIHFESLKIT